MPYANEHAARIRNPDKYEKLRRKNDEFGDGIDTIYGVKDDGKTEVQAIRFDSQAWTAARAKAWLTRNGYKPIEFEPAKEATKASRAVLFMPYGSSWETAAPATFASDGVGKVYRYRKGIMRTGAYRMDDGRMEMVTAERLSYWAQTWRYMDSAGISVPLSDSPDPHYGTSNPQNTAGRLVGVTVDGEELVGDFEIVGDDNLQVALANDVSVCAETMTDGKGRTWTDAITHVAITPYPRVEALGKWKRLAASLVRSDTEDIQDDPPVLTGDEQETGQKEADMNLEKLAAALGLAEPPAPEKAEEALLAALGALQAKHADALKAAQAETAKLTASLKPREEPSELVLKLAAQNRTFALNALVPGILSPATRDKLAAQFCAPERVKAAFARGDTGEDFEALVSALAGNVAVQTGEKSGPQAVALKPPTEPDHKAEFAKRQAQRDLEEYERAKLNGWAIPEALEKAVAAIRATK